MKYVITGASGNISKPTALQLLKRGHTVSVIGRNKENLKDLIAAGAIPLIGSVEDKGFLAGAFAGADAVYTMVPPKWDAPDWIAYIREVGKHYADALRSTGVKYVVNLSSVGAHLSNGVGPVSGLHYVENELNELVDANVKHLRPAYFYTNFFSNIGMIKNMHIIGGNSGAGDTQSILVDPSDIAEVAVEELDSLHFKGHSIRYIASQELANSEVAKVLGTAIGQPDLSWVEFTDDQSYQGMVAAGLPGDIAKNYTEMGASARSGLMFEDYYKNRPATFGKTKLKDFAKTFAAVYQEGAN